MKKKIVPLSLLGFEPRSRPINEGNQPPSGPSVIGQCSWGLGFMHSNQAELQGEVPTETGGCAWTYKAKGLL